MFQKDQEQKVLNRWFFGFLPLVVIFLSVLLISSNFISTYFVMSPRMSMEEWSCYGKPGDQFVWNEELDNLLLAQKFDPWNADIFMDLGRMYEWKALSSKAWKADSKTARSNASEYFKQAAIHRPTWALAWVNFAQSQLLNRVVDDEVYSAISKGFTFGRWQKDTQKKLLWISIGIWKSLPESIQEQVRDEIRFMLERENSIKMITSIALRFQWFDELVPLVSQEEDRKYIENVRSNENEMRKMLGQGEKNKDYVCRAVS